VRLHLRAAHTLCQVPRIYVLSILVALAAAWALTAFLGFFSLIGAPLFGVAAAVVSRAVFHGPHEDMAVAALLSAAIGFVAALLAVFIYLALYSG
jgi:hypothetical protein